MKKSDRSELIKGKKVVYIYHNTIDAIAEKPATQTKVFDACDDAISEITNLAGIIAGLRGSSEVIITSDHGFTYTYLPFKESQKFPLRIWQVLKHQAEDTLSVTKAQIVII